MVGNLLQFQLMRYLLNPRNRSKEITHRSKQIFCMSVKTIVAIIVLINLFCFFFVVTQLDESKIFQRHPEKTILLMWVEIQMISVPASILYYLITVWQLVTNRKRKKDNLNNPDIKEAIIEGAGLQE